MFCMPHWSGVDLTWVCGSLLFNLGRHNSLLVQLQQWHLLPQALLLQLQHQRLLMLQLPW
jgi:hypothetical protein